MMGVCAGALRWQGMKHFGRGEDVGPILYITEASKVTFRCLLTGLVTIINAVPVEEDSFGE